MDAYGYNALSGFLGSSNIKSNRQNELAYLDRILRMQQQQQLLDQKNTQETQQFIDNAYATALELTTGENAREKDILDFQQLSSNLLEPINEKIRLAGSLQNAKRLGIDQDIRAYQFKLLNNDKVFQIKKNTAAYAKYLETRTGDPKLSGLFPLSDLQSIHDWHSGKTDEIKWRGILDSPINTDFIEGMPQDQQVTEVDYVLNNLQGLAADYAYYASGGDKQREAQIYSEELATKGANIIASGYLKRRLGVSEFENIPTQYGQAEIKTSLGEELQKGQVELFPSTGLSFNELDQYGGFSGYVNSNKNVAAELSIRLGADDDLSNLDTKRNIRIDASHELFANDKQTLNRIVDAYFGSEGYYFTRGGGIKIRVNDSMLNKSYNYQGASLEGDLDYVDRTADDMEINGLFLGSKATYTDQATGELRTRLLVIDPRQKGDKTYLQKVLKNVNTNEPVSFRPAYLLQLREPDPLRDDIYYHEINIGSDAFMANIRDENYDKNLSYAKNTRASVQADVNDRNRRAEIDRNTYSALNRTYALEDGPGLQTLYSNHASLLKGMMAVQNIDKRMEPYIIAEVYDLAQEMMGEQKQANQPANFSTNVNLILSNFGNLQKDLPELYQAIMTGNPKNILQYYEATNPGIVEQKEKRYKLWGKYYRF
jgi:hypothetical protein